MSHESDDEAVPSLAELDAGAEQSMRDLVRGTLGERHSAPDLLAGEITRATSTVHTHKPPRPKPPRPEGV